MVSSNRERDTIMAFIDTVKELTNLCSYKPGWEIRVKQNDDRGVYIQLYNANGICSVQPGFNDGYKVTFRSLF